jgi:hypothetical protein
MKLCAPIDMPKGKAAELAAWMAREQPPEIGEPQWDALSTALAPISESYLRKLLRASGAPLAPLVEGVRQESLDALEVSLAKLLREYESGDAARRARIRRLVITAKDHARWVSRKSAAHRAEKEEMMLWMLTWLENPPLFPEWVRLRRAALAIAPKI